MKERHVWWFGCVGLVLVFASVACGPPESRFRRSALIPSALASTNIAPVDDGQVEVSASVSFSDTKATHPGLGDPGLHVAEANAVGQLRVGVHKNVSVGWQVQGAHRAWSNLSSHGTPPLRDDYVYGTGPNLSLHLGDPQWLSFSLAGALTWMSVPWAIWEIRDNPNARCFDCDERPNYRFVSKGRDRFVIYRVSMGPHMRLNDHFAIFSGVSFQNTMTNIGFDNEERAGSTLDNDHHYHVLFMGMTARQKTGLFARVQGFLAGSQTSVTLPTMGVQLTLGFNL